VLDCINRGGLIDEHHGDSIAHVVATLQPWVVQGIFVSDKKQWAFILRTRKNRE
jgi:hypothetical protein